MAHVTVIYGSGASSDSGFRISYPGRSGIENYPPPMDREFFQHPGIQRIYNTEAFLAIRKLRDWYLPKTPGIGLEQLWTYVDINHKQSILGTYDWREQNERYLKECGSDTPYPLSDVVPTLNYPITWEKLERPLHYSPRKFLGDCGRDLKRLIDWAFSSIENINSETSNYAKLHQKLRSHAESITYITFNYDLLLKQALKNLGDKHIYVGVHDTINSLSAYRTWKAQRGAFPILKLHGSLDWKLSSVHHDVEFAETPVSPTYPPQSNGPNSFIEPAIVPPTLFKTEINDENRLQHPLTRLLTNQWRATIGILAESDKVIVVGYSFPVTDFHAHRIFQIARMIRREKQLSQKVLVCLGKRLSLSEEKAKKEVLSHIFQIDADYIEIEYEFTNLVDSKKLISFLNN